MGFSQEYINYAKEIYDFIKQFEEIGASVQDIKVKNVVIYYWMYELELSFSAWCCLILILIDFMNSLVFWIFYR